MNKTWTFRWDQGFWRTSFICYYLGSWQETQRLTKLNTNQEDNLMKECLMPVSQSHVCWVFLKTTTLALNAWLIKHFFLIYLFFFLDINMLSFLSFLVLSFGSLLPLDCNIHIWRGHSISLLTGVQTSKCVFRVWHCMCGSLSCLTTLACCFDS